MTKTGALTQFVVPSVCDEGKQPELVDGKEGCSGTGACTYELIGSHSALGCVAVHAGPANTDGGSTWLGCPDDDDDTDVVIGAVSIACTGGAAAVCSAPLV